MFKKIFNILDAYRQEITPVTDAEKIKEKEKELGIGIDSILADFYIHFGNDSLFRKRINKYDNFEFDKLEDLENKDGYLCFGYLDKEKTRIAAKAENSDYSSVYSFINNKIWGVTEPFLSFFIYNTVIWKILYSMNCIAKCKIKDNQFKEMLGKEFEYIGADKALTNNYEFSVCKDKIFGIYTLNRGIYLAVNDSEEIIDELAKKYDLDLEWVKLPEGSAFLDKMKKPKKLSKTRLKVLNDIDLNDLFEKLDVYRNTSEQLNRTECRSDISLPKPLLEFYEHYSNAEEMFRSDFEFTAFDEKNIKDNIICIGQWHIDDTVYGVEINRKEEPGYQLCVMEDDGSRSVSEELLPVFLTEKAAWNILMNMQGVANAEISDSKFKRMLKTEFKYLCDEKEFKTGPIVPVTAENILGCYMPEENLIYLGTNCDDDILNDFEEKNKLDLDWL